MTRDPQLYFPSEGSHTQDFYALKNPSTPTRIESANLVSRDEYDNHWTTGVDKPPDLTVNAVLQEKLNLIHLMRCLC